MELVIYKPNSDEHIKKIYERPLTCEQWQEIVGGYFEIVLYTEDKIVVCKDDAHGLLPNKAGTTAAGKLGDCPNLFYGIVVIADIKLME